VNRVISQQNLGISFADVSGFESQAELRLPARLSHRMNTRSIAQELLQNARHSIIGSLQKIEEKSPEALQKRVALIPPQEIPEEIQKIIHRIWLITCLHGFGSAMLGAVVLRVILSSVGNASHIGFLGAGVNNAIFLHCLYFFLFLTSADEFNKCTD